MGTNNVIFKTVFMAKNSSIGGWFGRYVIDAMLMEENEISL